MAWSAWKEVWSNWASTNKEDTNYGAAYAIKYRTNSYSALGQAQIEYYVYVPNTGETFSERWNSVVELTVDGTVAIGKSHTESYVGNDNTAKQYSTVFDSTGKHRTGYYIGYVCIPRNTSTSSDTRTSTSIVSTKNVNTSTGKASWTFSLAGGFRSSDSRVCKIAQFTVEVDGYTSVGKPTVTITDNYDNTFTITATKGANGKNNAAKGVDTLKCSYDTATYGTTYVSGNKNTLAIADGSKATRTVYAKARTVGTHNNSAETTTSKAIKQYVVPSAPGKPTISYTKSRLTIKENWTFSWTAATKANDSSPVKGYRIVLYKKSPTDTAYKSIEIKNTGGVTISTSTDGIHTFDTTSLSLTIDPAACGILPKDLIKLGVKPYTRYGNTNTGNILARSSFTESDVYEVKSSGIMRVKTSSGFVEGQVFVCTNVTSGKPTWTEAESVLVKTSSTTWTEAE